MYNSVLKKGFCIGTENVLRTTINIKESFVMNATLLIMAAGMGSRYGGDKQIDRMGPGGEMLLEYSIHDAVLAGFNKVVFVIKRAMEDTFRERLGEKIAKKVPVYYAFQEYDSLPEGFTPPQGRVKPYGTVHAVYAAREVIHEPFAVINADDYYGQSAFKTMYDSLRKLDETNAASMVGYYLRNTVSENGHVTRGLCATDERGKLQAVTETYQIKPFPDGTIRDTHTDANGVILDPNALVSMNFWGFTPWFFNACRERLTAFVNSLAADEMKAEYPLPVMIDELMQANMLSVDVLSSDAVWFGVTYKEDKPYVINELQKLHDAGVYPPTLG